MEDEEEEYSSLSEPHLIGFVIANIVGLRYYTGTVNGRELVVLQRQPLNPYDSNAIAVLNTRSAQVGHLERPAAAALAPLIDSHLALAEAIVPKAPGRNPKNPGFKPHRLPCQIHLFTRPDAEEIVRVAVEEAGLQLIEPNDHEFGLSQASILTEDKKQKGKKRDMDEIFSLVGKGEKAQIIPMEPPKDIITSELFQHQKEGLGWLFQREKSSDLPPFWEEKGNNSFTNILTNYTTQERPEPLKGGIFADEMGLGKTLTLLSLIATTKKEYETETSSQSSTKKKRKRNSDQMEISSSKITLVICPPSVFSSWITQLEQHTKPGSLKVYLYHGSDRTKQTKELLKHDIIFTTYSTLSSEFTNPNSPIKEINWYRIILDEAHVIKNYSAQQTKAVIALRGERKWVVTGTPIQNNSFDLFPLMVFLEFQPFSIKSYWNSLVQRPLAQGSSNGLSRLQALLGAISLRRTKEAPGGGAGLGLPAKTIETCLIELSPEEREIYDKLELEAQDTVREFIDSDTVLRNYSTVLHIILRLRQICDDVALCPPDIKSLLPSNLLEDVSNNPELLNKLASLVQDGDDFDCPICLSPPAKTVITSCTHIFCQNCIMKILKNPNSVSRCPICRRSLSKSDLFLAPPTPSDDSSDSNPNSNNSNKPISSKVSTLLKLLTDLKKSDPLKKSVVFSQFRKMLLLLEEPLKNSGFKILRLDGSMSANKRSQVIKEFSLAGPGAPAVLLASLKAAGTGINLTAACRVFLMEPWWNPGVEEQAMDRVHRIGQREEVRVVRMIVRGSIEERIVEMQERKARLASGAFGNKGSEEVRRMRVDDLRMMMRI